MMARIWTLYTQLVRNIARYTRNFFRSLFVISSAILVLMILVAIFLLLVTMIAENLDMIPVLQNWIKANLVLP